MKATGDRQYLIGGVGNIKFGIPLSSVLNVATLTALEADRLEAEGLYEWQDTRYERLQLAGITHQAREGDSVLIMKMTGAPRALACEPRLVSRSAERLLMIPEKLRLIHPTVRTAFLNEGELVHCLAAGEAAA